MSNYKKKEIIFKRLDQVDKQEIIALMNNPLVRRQLPLAKKAFDDTEYANFIKTKNNLWEEHGYGPWAFFVNKKFVGWGGLQFEQGDPDLALILHPNYWGIGKLIYECIIDRAFNEMGFDSITILLPTSRKHSKALLRLDFKPDGFTTIDGESFIRFRLTKKHTKTN